MRKVLVAIALLALTGCAAIIDEMYDDQSRSQCRESRDPSGCHDRVDQNRQTRDRGH